MCLNSDSQRVRGSVLWSWKANGSYGVLTIYEMGSCASKGIGQHHQCMKFHQYEKPNFPTEE